MNEKNLSTESFGSLFQAWVRGRSSSKRSRKLQIIDPDGTDMSIGSDKEMLSVSIPPGVSIVEASLRSIPMVNVSSSLRVSSVTSGTNPVHQARIAEVRRTFPGKWEQWDSAPRGGVTHLQLIVQGRRDKCILEGQMKEWHEHHPESKTILRPRSGLEFRVMRTACVHCEKKWYDHMPSGGQCLFAATSYLEAPRQPATWSPQADLKAQLTKKH